MAARKAVPLDMNTEVPAEYLKHIEHITAENPLAKTLMMAALLENLLMSLLHAFLRESDTTESLFEIRGEIDGYSKCVRVAYCLGLIPKILMKNLLLIGSIRNRFAHSTEPLDFSDAKIAGYCRALQLPKTEGMELVETFFHNSFPVPGAEGKMITVGGFLFAELLVLIATVKRVSQLPTGIKWDQDTAVMADEDYSI